MEVCIGIVSHLNRNQRRRIQCYRLQSDVGLGWEEKRREKRREEKREERREEKIKLQLSLDIQLPYPPFYFSRPSRQKDLRLPPCSPEIQIQVSRQPIIQYHQPQINIYHKHRSSTGYQTGGDYTLLLRSQKPPKSTTIHQQFGLAFRNPKRTVFHQGVYLQIRILEPWLERESTISNLDGNTCVYATVEETLS